MTNEFYTEIIDKNIYIDSNILMNENFKILLDELIHHKIIVKMPKIQYDEIYNLSKKDDKSKSHGGREALRNIELLLDNDLLDTNGITNNKNNSAYADPEFIKIIFEDLENKKEVIFITDDRDLRIQIKKRLKEHKEYKESLNIYTFSDLPYPIYEEQQEQQELKRKKKQEEIRERIRKMRLDRNKDRINDTKRDAKRAADTTEKASNDTEDKNNSKSSSTSWDDFSTGEKIVIGTAAAGAAALYGWFNL